MNTQSVINRLLEDRPSFHGQSGEYNWALGSDVLEWLGKTIQPGDYTLETGCGYSTIVFAASGANHTTISPVAEEHTRIRSWGQQNGISFETVKFFADRSENVLPTLESIPIRVALIDGWHAFPGPFLDWFFVCKALQVGGFVIVDDTQLRTCAILRDFLASETPRWRRTCCLGKTEVFEKLTDDLFVGDWPTQPFNTTIAEEIPAPKSHSGMFIRSIPGVVPFARMLRSLNRRIR